MNEIEGLFSGLLLRGTHWTKWRCLPDSDTIEMMGFSYGIFEQDTFDSWRLWYFRVPARSNGFHSSVGMVDMVMGWRFVYGHPISNAPTLAPFLRDELGGTIIELNLLHSAGTNPIGGVSVCMSLDRVPESSPPQKEESRSREMWQVSAYFGSWQLVLF